MDESNIMYLIHRSDQIRVKIDGDLYESVFDRTRKFSEIQNSSSQGMCDFWIQENFDPPREQSSLSIGRKI